MPASRHASAGEGAPLCSGVVYRVRDSAIIVAVDESPEEGLDQPLRLEKLANEVGPRQPWDTQAYVCGCSLLNVIWGRGTGQPIGVLCEPIQMLPL